jgi:2-C-methyl-D-erythritol 4-phosphate cytidylyltransferase
VAAAVVVAAGTGRRMGNVRKQYLPLLGRPILEWSLRAFLDHPAVDLVVAVVPEEDARNPPEWLRALPVRLAPGGAERADSVWNGLDHLPASVDLVLIHDGARPLVSRAVIDRVLARAPAGAAVASVPATDTMKVVDAEGRVERTLERGVLRHAQTPQGFPLATLRAAHERARREHWSATDDAALCERCGVPVYLVEGAPENLKITRPLVLRLAEALALDLPAGGG